MPALARVGVPDAPDRGGLSGDGATVCVIDSGIDVRHIDFQDAAGRTRIRWLLDLSAPPRGRHRGHESAFGGAVWSAADLDEAIARRAGVPSDTHGHGTAVASLAAGDGSDGSERERWGEFAGVAPAASMVVVKALRATGAGFSDDDIVRGARFCLEVETLPGTTAIVIALGNHDGGHDGADAIEQQLDALADRAPIVVAAGNDTVGAHVRGWIPQEERSEIVWEIPASQGEGQAEAIFVADPTIRLSLRAPEGTETAEVAAGEVAMRAGPRATISVVATEPARPDGAQLFRLRAIAPPGENLRGGSYIATVRGPGAFHGWIAGAELPSALFSPRFSGPWVDRSASVMVPATASLVIAVGASITQETILTDEATLSMGHRVSGRAAWFSPRGPTRTGGPKPDVLAPGGWNVAALSGDLVPNDTANLFRGSFTALREARIGSDHIAVRGTSQAAPIVAGAIALTLAVSPWRGRYDARRACATSLSEGTHAWDSETGCGRFHLLSWVASSAHEGATPDPRGVRIVSTEPSVSGSTRTLHFLIRATDHAGLPAEGVLDLVIGGDRSVVEIHRGVGEAAWTVSDRAAITARVELGGEEVARLDVPISPPPAAKTCSAHTPKSATDRGLGWFLLGLALTRRRRFRDPHRGASPPRDAGSASR